MPRTTRLLLGLMLAVHAARPQAPQLPTPESVLGFKPGAECKLADYDQVVDYFKRLAAVSNRVRFEVIGQTTNGLGFGMATISSPENLRRLEEIRKANLRLTDPRAIEAAEAEAIIASGKTIVLLNASIHSIEVGPTQSTMNIAYMLASTEDPAWLKVLDDVVLLLTPSHNPDGYNQQVRWYRRWVGTPYEGCPMPDLYNRYVGHDNNRDWFMLTQVESRLTVEQIHDKWRPQIVLDMHQMGESGPRIFVPPYQSPIEPNVDPILVEEIEDLGASMRKDLIERGCTGVVSNQLFDGWTPGRAFMHYHGGARILTEIASCRQASSVDVKPTSRSASRPSSQPTETDPTAWVGKRWTLADIVRYNDEAAFALLRHASAKRETWLRNFHRVFQKACEPDPVLGGFIIPAQQSSVAALSKLMDIMALAGLEVYRTTRPMQVQKSRVESSALFIPSAQPYFAFARAMLDGAPYPEVRDRPGGRIRKPYDVTAHDLRLLLDLDVRLVPAAQRGAILASSIRLVDAAGAVELRPDDTSSDVILRGVQAARTFAAKEPGAFAVYRPWTASMDEGWTRFFFDQFGIEIRSLSTAAIRTLASDHGTESQPVLAPKVLILPDLSTDLILNGATSSTTPPEVKGGIGDAGARWIDRFVREQGGTLIALKDSTAFAIKQFNLPVVNAVTETEPGEINVPGALLRLDINPPVATWLGLPRTWVPAMFDGGKAFRRLNERERDPFIVAETIASWSDTKDLRLAGYAEGTRFLARRGAIVRVRVGRGVVYLFGFSPLFRFQTWSTFPLFLAALTGEL